jgi:hypothetical protein
MQTKKWSESRARRGLVAAPACALALLCTGATAASAEQATGALVTSKQPASATVEQCLTTGSQSERAATFVGEMTAVPGTARMQMRIEVLERMPDEALFRSVSYPGLGVWLRSSPGVKTFKDLDKVTDLSAPAAYRAAIRFRWLNAHGHAIKLLELRTPRCEQPALTDSGTSTAPSTGTGTGATTSATAPQQ